MASNHALRDEICSSLPEEICERSSDLVDLRDTRNPNKEFIDFIKKYVPLDFRSDFLENLTKNVPLGRKTKIIRPSRRNKGKQGQHRGKKRLTHRERRELGIDKIKTKNKTFEMFLPVNDMWKSYAESVLGINHMLEKGYDGTCNNNMTYILQGKIRRLEYFGCLLRVTKSRCSEYIGITGIVIKETKNTFVMICPDDKVKTIPKLHSEFSFVISGIGISLPGNYVHQRSFDRAKYNCKLPCLFL